jgi:hypothetical protein
MILPEGLEILLWQIPFIVIGNKETASQEKNGIVYLAPANL